jgi:Domain of unknown function (DUF1707)
MPGDDVGEVRLRASDADRERVAGLLGEALADGRLTVDEHRERIGILYATRTLDELTPLTADLGTERRDVERQRSAAPVERVASQVAILSSSMARPTGRVKGRMVAFAFLGDARIDLTHASFGEDGRAAGGTAPGRRPQTSHLGCPATSWLAGATGLRSPAKRSAYASVE